MNDRGAFLRGQLASVGIFLDEPTAARERSRCQAEEAEPDREQIRAILTFAGAPEDDIAWLTASAPSIAHALKYRPPR